MAIGGRAQVYLRRFGGKSVVLGDDPCTIGVRTLADRWEHDGNGGQAQTRRTVIRIETGVLPSLTDEATLVYDGSVTYVVGSTERVAPDGLFTDIIVRELA